MTVVLIAKFSEGCAMNWPDDSFISREISPEMGQMMCDCFGYTAADIRKDAEKNRGKSTILEQIVTAKKTEGWSCTGSYPEGR